MGSTEGGQDFGGWRVVKLYQFGFILLAKLKDTLVWVWDM